MQHASQTAGLSAPPPPGVAQSRLKREDLAYQSMTVAAILLVLCSLWVF